MAEINVPDLAITTAPPKKVSSAAQAILLDGHFGVAVVEDLGSFSTPKVANLTVLKQAPTPGAKLTTGELMHLYVSGAGTVDEATSSAASPTARRVAWIEFAVIVFLVFYCFVLRH